MASHAYALSILPQMYGVDTPARQRSKAKIAFSELVRPDGYWPQPYSLEQAFQIYRWMVVTGKPFTGFGEYGVYDLFLGRGGLGDTDLHYSPIVSIDMLRKRFHYAILGRSNGSNSSEWRQKEGIEFGRERVLKFQHYTPFAGTPLLGKVLSEAQVRHVLESFFEAKGKLRVQLNKCHRRAIQIVKLSVNVDTHDGEFSFILTYGYNGSEWAHTLASGSQFIDTLGAAVVEFERVSGQNLLAQALDRRF